MEEAAMAWTWPYFRDHARLARFALDLRDLPFTFQQRWRSAAMPVDDKGGGPTGDQRTVLSKDTRKATFRTEDQFNCHPEKGGLIRWCGICKGSTLQPSI